MKHVFSHLRPYVRETVLAPLLKMSEALLELLVPLVVAAIVDRGIAAHDRGYVLGMALLLVLLGVVGLGFSVTAQFFAARAAVGFAGRVRFALFQKTQTLPVPELDRLGTSTLITRMSADVDRAQSGVNMVLRLLLRSPFVVFGAMVMAYIVDVPSGVIFTVAIAALSAVVFLIMLVTMPLHRRLQGRLDRVVGLTRENIGGARVIRAFGREEDERRAVAEESRLLRSLQLLVGRISAILNPLTVVMLNFAVIVLLEKGAIRVDSGRLTQGEMIALYNYMTQILVELIKLADLIVTLTRAIASGKRIDSVLASDASLARLSDAEPDRSTSEHIVFSDVSMTYPGASASALTGITLSVKRGETVGIIGGTGSGKSSLVSLIAHFYDPSAGSVLIDGVDTRAYPTELLRSRIGFVLQRSVLFTGTIRENLLVGNPDARDEDLLLAVHAAQADDVLAAKGGLDGAVSQGGKNLSGGQRQRLAIARALVRRPEILILDDSSSALDYATDARLRAALGELSGEMTILVISQRTVALSSADRIFVLEDGELVGEGTHAELLSGCDVYREIHESQSDGDGREGGAR